jgi:raffinose/stachyose/melibiose transport system permease protein
MSTRIDRLTTYAILGVFAVIVLLPFLSVLSVALTPSGSTVSGLRWPDDLAWSNFADAWRRGNFGRLLINSATVAVVVVPVATALSVLAGYAFGTMRFPGRTVLFYAFLAGIIIPYETIVIPLYFDLSSWGLTDRLAGLMLPQIGLFLCFGTFWMRAFFLSTPASLIEAASIDGANSLQVLGRVLLPIARPAITTLMILILIWSWNEFLMALVLIQDPATRTAPAGLGVFVGQFASDEAGLAAGALLVTAPILLFYLIAQRKIIAGLLEGALKG